MRRILLSVAIMGVCYSALAGGISKWVDANGKTHYGSQPPAGISTTKVKKPSAAASTPVLTSRRKVVLYSTAWCGYCKKARAYMNNNNIQFTERDIDNSVSAKLDYDRLGGRGVPFLVRGGSDIQRGFNTRSYDNFFARTK